MGATDDWLASLGKVQGARTATVLSVDDRNPDDLADQSRIGQQLGLPPIVVASDPAAFKAQAEQKRNADLLASSPITAKWLQDRENGGLAKDDIENLSWFEKVLRAPSDGLIAMEKDANNTQFGLGVRTGFTGLKQMATATATIPFSAMEQRQSQYLDLYKRTADLGPSTSRADMAKALGVDPMSVDAELAYSFLTATPEQRAKQVDLSAQFLLQNKGIKDSLVESVNAFSDEMKATQGRVPNFTDIEDVKGFADWVGFNVGQAAPFLAAVFAAGAVGGTPAVLGSGYAMGVGDIQSGLIEEGITDKGAVALVGGVPYAGLEMLGPAAAMFRGVSSPVIQQVARGYFNRLARAVPAMAVEEFINEAGQEIVKDVSVAAGGGKPVELNDETLLRWFNSGMAGVAGGVGMSSIVAMNRNAERAAKSGATADVLAQVDEMAAASKLKARSPDKFAEAVSQSTEGAFIYVPAEGLNSYFQAKDTGFNPEDWGIDPLDFEEQMAAGGQVAVPIGIYASKVSAGTDDAAWFRENSVMSDDEMSISEAARFNEEVRSDLEAAMAEAEVARASEMDAVASDVQVYDGLYGQLRAAGRAVDVATNEAKLMTSFFRTMASRYGDDALALAQRFGLTIRGPEAPEVRRRGNLDIALNTLRRGTKAARGSTLLDFVQAEGGIRDVGGDLEAMGAPKGVISQTRGQFIEQGQQASLAAPVAAAGKGIDDMARAAVQAGYFPDYSGQDADMEADLSAVLMEAIREEISGRPTFAPGEGRDASLDALAEELGRRGIDVGTLSNDDIAAALAVPVEGDTYGQDGRLVTDTPEFKAWFGDSKVVDDGGKPLAVYHGSDKTSQSDPDFAFRTGQSGARSYGFASVDTVSSGNFFSPSQNDAAEYGSDVGVYYLSIQNPLRDPRMMESSSRKPNAAAVKMWEDIPYIFEPVYGEMNDEDLMSELFTSIGSRGEQTHAVNWQALDDPEVTRRMAERGYDGSLVEEPNDNSGISWFAPDPTQIKSVFNRGTFDGSDPRILYQPAYHGSPHVFDKFSLDKIGTGEGAQAFGWGLYFAGRKEVAKHYRDDLSGMRNGNAKRALARANGDIDAAIAATEAEIARLKSLPNGGGDARRQAAQIQLQEEKIAALRDKKDGKFSDGRLFKVDIPDDADLLDWDAPLSKQPEGVREKLKPLVDELKSARMNEFDRKEILNGKASGDLFYNALRLHYSNLAYADGSALTAEMKRKGEGWTPENLERNAAIEDRYNNADRLASKALRDAGIPGHRYLDGGSRVDGDGSRNYVIYDENAVNVLEFEQQARGQITFPAGGIESGQTVINLFETANLSTLIHESGHYFLEAFTALANDPAAPQAMRDDLAAIFRWMDVPASTTGGDAGTVQSIIDRLQLHTQTLSNLSVTKSGGPEGESHIGIEPVLAMLRDVRSAVNDPQILDAVVRSLPVDVMNVLGGSQASAKAALHNDAMLKSVFAGVENDNVTVPVNATLSAGRAGLLRDTVSVVARASAEMAAIPGRLGRGQAASSAAVSANNSDGQGVSKPDGGQELDSLFDGWRQLSVSEKTKRHEQFARGLEAYFLEGKSPSLELADVFSRAKAWLLRIYQSVRGLNVKLSPEIREVFDRMIATDAEIIAARDAQGMKPLFTSEAAAGMSPEAFTTYQRMARRATEQAQANLMEKTMAVIRRRQEAWWKAEKVAVTKEVEPFINSQRPYRLVEMLANKRWLGDATRDIPDMQMDRQELVDMFGLGVLTELSRERLGGNRAIYANGGASLFEVADMFGFANPQEMVAILQNAGKRKDAIAAEVDRVMTERHGDPLNDGSIEEEALAAIHSAQQAKTVAAEVRHLAKRAGLPVRNLTSQVFRARAKLMIGRMTVAQATRPDAFLGAERQAAKRAEDAFARVARGGGQEVLVAATRYKEQQLLNHYLYLESRDLTKAVASGRERMRNYSKANVRKKLEGGYIEQIDALLDQYDFRVRSAGQIRKAESLTEFVQRMVAEGREGDLSIDPRLIARAAKKHYSRLSVDELRGLFDTIENIDHLGRFKQRLIDAKKKRDLAASVQVLTDAIEKNFGTDKLGKESAARSTFNLLWTMDTMLVEYDGMKEIGPVYEEIKEPIDAGASMEQAMNIKLAGAMDELFKVYSQAELDEMVKPKVIDGANGRPWAKVEILAVALNMGNADNKARLFEPGAAAENRLTQDQADALTATMDRRDWEFVQAMWDYIDSYYPQLAEVHLRRTGTKLKKVDAVPVETPHGTFRGGYYPIKYDGKFPGPAAKDEAIGWDKFLASGLAKAEVKSGMTQERQQGSGGRTLKLDLTVPFSHLRDTVRVIALSEAVDNAYRILNDKRTVAAFFNAGRRNDLDVFNLWLKDLAQGPVRHTDAINSFARIVKNNFTLSRLAFNLKTAALQVTGTAQSAAVIGKRNMLQGMMDYSKRPRELAAEVIAKSPLMAGRRTSMNKDIYDFMNDVELTGPLAGRWSKFKTGVSKWGFAPMTFLQFYSVDVPTWLGAYNSGLKQFGDEGKAAAYADRMIARSQDSGLMADRSAIGRGTLSKGVQQADFVRVFTTLGGYMLTKMNRGYITAKRGASDVRGAATPTDAIIAATSAATNLMLLYVAEGAMMALMYSVAFGGDDDEPDDYMKFVATETVKSVFGGAPFVRDAATAFQGYGSGGVLGSVLEIPANIYVQATQGENDKALRRSIADMVGTVTGMPTTATMRLIEEAVDTKTPSMVEAVFGQNPVGR